MPAITSRPHQHIYNPVSQTHTYAEHTYHVYPTEEVMPKLIPAALSDIKISGPAQTPEFAGTVESTSPFLPGVSPGTSMTTHTTPGLPLLIDDLTGEPFLVDPFNLHGEGRSDGSSWMALGPRRHGKTTAAMWFATMLASRQTPGPPMRLMADVHRRNAGKSEMGKLVKQFGCDLVPLQDYELNLFAAGMLNTPQALDMAKDSLELTNKRILSIDQYEALSIAMGIMYSPAFVDLACPTLLSILLDRMSPADIQHYRRDIEQKFIGQHKGHLALERLMKRTAADVSDTVAAAHKVAKLVRRMVAKSCIGDVNSLATAMKQRFFSPDYTGLTDEDLVLIQAYIWRVKTLAIMDHRIDLYFNIEIHDENYKLCKYPEYIRPMTEFLKALRGVETFVWLNSHRLADYSSVGAVGSLQYQLAQNMIDDIDTFLIGPQPESARADIVTRVGLTDTEFDVTKNLQRFQWGLKMRTEPFRRVSFTPTSGVLEASYSEAANDSMVIPDGEDDDE